MRSVIVIRRPSLSNLMEALPVSGIHNTDLDPCMPDRIVSIRQRRHMYPKQANDIKL